MAMSTCVRCNLDWPLWAVDKNHLCEKCRVEQAALDVSMGASNTESDQVRVNVSYTLRGNVEVTIPRALYDRLDDDNPTADEELIDVIGSDALVDGIHDETVDDVYEVKSKKGKS